MTVSILPHLLWVKIKKCVHYSWVLLAHKLCNGKCLWVFITNFWPDYQGNCKQGDVNCRQSSGLLFLDSIFRRFQHNFQATKIVSKLIQTGQSLVTNHLTNYIKQIKNCLLPLIWDTKYTREKLRSNLNVSTKTESRNRHVKGPAHFLHLLSKFPLHI